MSPKRNAFLKAMLEQSNVSNAMKAAKISRATAYKYLNDPEFQKELAEQQANCLKEAVCYMKGKLSKCAEELVHIGL